MIDLFFQFKMPFKAPSSDGKIGKIKQEKNHAALVWVVDRKRIAIRYFKSWFLIDLISVLPFDSLGLFFPAIKKLAIFRILRVIRLVKLLRAMRASGIVQKYQVCTSVTGTFSLSFCCSSLAFDHPATLS